MRPYNNKLLIQVMRKLFFLAVAALFSLSTFAQTSKGYVITGAVEGAANGDTVFLRKVQGRQFVNIAKTVIKNGTFTFKGTQAGTAHRYISCGKGDKSLTMDFFLENGSIKIKLGKENDSASGTANNDAYQEYRSQIGALNAKAMAAYEEAKNPKTSEAVQKQKMAEVDACEKEMMALAEATINKNLHNAVGVQLFKQTYYEMSTEQVEKILNEIPASFQKDPEIMSIKQRVMKQKTTAAGKKFVDFEMKTPDGKPIKLSDYVGKGKVVLIDFWASWCGPCRKEMPNIVKLYQQYKDKGFEIVGVSLDKSNQNWKDAIAKLGITWPQMSDLKYWDCAGAKLYAVNAIPHTVLIDGNGVIIARGLVGEELAQKLAEILK